MESSVMEVLCVIPVCASTEPERDMGFPRARDWSKRADHYTGPRPVIRAQPETEDKNVHPYLCCPDSNTR
ncbi:hypothetical protein GMO_04640 [Gluconobacter morbifer G707]|uniref:Uncharacterized protein n=1 Tax=Gluconobacter morbifer G707 TaxID=1088869 RepID=G6XG49_9PROT|nr:hypothetical protein GMO_04640 [Gluconobacter morbifer G707]